MLKVVVFDGGFGGELFADLLEEEIPIIEVIRVIDWRHADALTENARRARKIAETALEPYLGEVDLIIFANHLLSLTSLRYFRRKYPNQKFLGLSLDPPKSSKKRRYLVLTTKAVSKSLNYHHFLFHLPIHTRTLKLDRWPSLIDDGELSRTDIASTFENKSIPSSQPRDIILACATFRDIKPELSDYFHHRVRIYDGFDHTLKTACKMLNLRGARSVGHRQRY